MVRFTTRIKREILMKRGIVEAELLTKRTELDRSIISAANAVLEPRLKTCFLVAFDCKLSAEEVIATLYMAFDKKVQPANIQRYIRDAARIIIDESANSEDINQWQQKMRPPT